MADRVMHLTAEQRDALITGFPVSMAEAFGSIEDACTAWGRFRLALMSQTGVASAEMLPEAYWAFSAPDELLGPAEGWRKFASRYGDEAAVAARKYLTERRREFLANKTEDSHG